jgi:hypothetical protein
MSGQAISETMSRTAHLSIVPAHATCGECERLRLAHDGIHRKYMGLRATVQEKRRTAARLETELAAMRAMLIAYCSAFRVIAGG